MNILLLGFAFALPYHVMRCAAAAGHQVTVLGNGPAQGLLRSPSCTDLYLSDFDYRSQDYRALVQEIAHLSIAIGFDMVMPSDDVSTRALAAIKEAIPLPTTPLPTLDIFDTLNDKTRFAHFCAEHGIPARDDLDHKTLGITALCQQGQMVAHAVEERSARQLRIHEAPNLVAPVSRLVEASNFDGILHCDAVIDRATDLFHLTRCRPCFAPSIHPTMIAGLNFADAVINLSHGGLPPQPTLPPTTIKLYPAALRALAMPWRLSRRDWQMLRYHWNERELLRMRVDDSDVFARAPEEDASPAERLAS
ncbi:MAG TPA: hypothetical protein VHY80_08300 [Stellaceae bacterium]|nr:hypothetical protein [Stellaceae bacterium]